MKTFIIKRFLALIPMLLAITLMVFLLMNLAPGDFLTPIRAQPDIDDRYIEQLEEEFGLNKHPVQQYFLWLRNIFPISYSAETGLSFSVNFGYSWTYRVMVSELLMQRIPATLLLSCSSLLIAWSVAIPLGVLAAIYKDSIFDRVSALLAYAALSIPEFFLALLAIFFAAQTGLFPIGGLTSPHHEFLPLGGRILDILHHLILPALVLGLGSVAGLMRIMRSSFLDVIRSDFVTTARAKGMPEGTIMFRHVFRNAINPLISMMGFAFSSLLSGALLVETVMNYPGLGQLIFQAFLRQDQFVVLGAVVMGSVMLVAGNLLADIALAKVDPRIRLEK